MPKTQFQCTSCQYISPKWLGKCPQCGEWDSFQEIQIADKTSKKSKIPQLKVNSSNQKQLINSNLEVNNLESLLKTSQDETEFFHFQSDFLNHFFGQGLAKASLTLLTGEPGLGKSTLSLQLLRSLYQKSLYPPPPLKGGDLEKSKKSPLKILYVSGEESLSQVSLRAKRLGLSKEINLVQTNKLEEVEKLLTKEKFNLVLIDSIQAIFSTELDSGLGSITQVNFITATFLQLSKQTGTSFFLIGHVNKDGQVAGPKTLEHMVDTVLSMEKSSQTSFLTLNIIKNRFGSTQKQLLLKMTQKGLEIIPDASLSLLENFENGVGVCYGLSLEKNLPLVIEIQALISDNFSEGGFLGKREAVGFKVSKLNLILAILQKYLNINLKSKDVYLQVIGLNKQNDDTNLDLAVLLAILSSFYQKSLLDLKLLAVMPPSPLSPFITTQNKPSFQPVFAGRISLSGNLRKPTELGDRKKVAQKLKLNLNPKIDFKDKGSEALEKIRRWFVG